MYIYSYFFKCNCSGLSGFLLTWLFDAAAGVNKVLPMSRWEAKSNTPVGENLMEISISM